LIRKSKVAEFDIIVLVDEDIFGLQISVDDIRLVQVFNRQNKLSNYEQADLFREKIVVPNLGFQITPFTIVHN